MKKARAKAVVVATTIPWRIFVIIWLTALLVGLMAPASRAADDGQYKVVDGIGVYYGVMPAGIVRGHSPSHTERSMHGGPADNEYHLVVALFDTATSVRIENAKVTARISPLATAGPSHLLEPMQIAGTVSYGGYFPLSVGDRYTIHVEIERPGAARAAAVDFSYDHRQH